MAKKTPALLYIIGVGFFLASLVHLLALWMVFHSWSWLRVFEIEPGTGYLVFKNLFFALGFLLAGIVLLRRVHWAPWLGGVLSLAEAAWFWLDRTVLNQSPLPFARHIFALVITLLLLGVGLLSMWVLSPFMHPATQAGSFEEVNEEKS